MQGKEGGKMKEKLMNNLGLKILALLFSAILWMIVMNAENPIDERTFTDVPVTVANAQVVTNKGKTYQIEEGYRTVSVTVRAKRETLDKLRIANIEVVMDFRNPWKLDDTYKLTAKVKGYEVESVEVSPYAIPVVIDDNSSETFVITPVASGNVQNGYELDKLTADPASVVISGPETVVNSIDRVVAEVDVNGLSEETEKTAELVLYDSNNNQVDPTRLSFNIGDDGVTVRITLKETKNVQLQFDTSEIKTADGYEFKGITVKPERVAIVGSEEQLEKIDGIMIPAEELAETGLTQKVEKRVDITPYLPEGIELVEEGAGTVVVEIQVEMYGAKTFEVPYSSVYLANVPSGFEVTYDMAGILSVQVSGSEKDLEDLKLDQTNVSVNLVTYSVEGTYKVPVQINLTDGYTLLSKDLTMEITLKKE